MTLTPCLCSSAVSGRGWLERSSLTYQIVFECFHLLSVNETSSLELNPGNQGWKEKSKIQFIALVVSLSEIFTLQSVFQFGR